MSIISEYIMSDSGIGCDLVLHESIDIDEEESITVPAFGDLLEYAFLVRAYLPELFNWIDLRSIANILDRNTVELFSELKLPYSMNNKSNFKKENIPNYADSDVKNLIILNLAGQDKRCLELNNISIEKGIYPIHLKYDVAIKSWVLTDDYKNQLGIKLLTH